MADKDNSFEWNQFCRLGEMMGDGLHHEPDGKWIVKEYNALAKKLMPDAFTTQRKMKNETVNIAVKKRLLTDRCSKCNSEMAQSRSGSYVVECAKCGARFKYKQSSQK